MISIYSERQREAERGHEREGMRVRVRVGGGGRDIKSALGSGGEPERRIKRKNGEDRKHTTEIQMAFSS